MNPSYRRDKDHNYMVLDAPQALQGTEYQIRMLVGNHIPHLLKCHMRMMDGKPVFFYEITGMQPLFRIFEKAAMNEEDIRNILDGVKAALENTERFLLDGNQLLFEPEYMFLDIQTREVNMCCLPSYVGSMTENFRKLAEYILKKLDHSEEQAVMLGYDIYSRTAEENYCLSEVLQLIYQSRRKEEKYAAEPLGRTEQKIYEGNDDTDKDRFAEEIIEQEETDLRKNDLSGEGGYLKENNLSGKRGYLKENNLSGERGYSDKRSFIKKECKWKKWIFPAAGCLGIIAVMAALMFRGMLNYAQSGGILFVTAGIGIYFMSARQKEDTDEKNRRSKKNQCRKSEPDFMGENGTCVLREKEETDIAVLISTRPEKYDNILLYKDEIHIGKEEWQADICIPCNVVSRVHARVMRREGHYYLTDLSSTNGTFINEKRIAPMEAVLLEQGDRVKFADVEYIFQV